MACMSLFTKILHHAFMVLQGLESLYLVCEKFVITLMEGLQGKLISLRGNVTISKVCEADEAVP